MLTALTPSKAWSERQGLRHRTVTEWARLLLLTLRRWLPNRPIVAVMDGEFAALELLHALRPSMAVMESHIPRHGVSGRGRQDRAVSLLLLETSFCRATASEAVQGDEQGAYVVLA